MYAHFYLIKVEDIGTELHVVDWSGGWATPWGSAAKRPAGTEINPTVW